MSKQEQKQKGTAAASQPLLSVVIPLYNKEQYIRQTAESILQQTLQNLELLVVDNKSIDGGRAIVQEIAHNDKRVRIVDEFDHQGVSWARNTGIEAARGKYLAFVDADDFVDPPMYERVVQLMEEGSCEYGEVARDCYSTDYDVCLYPAIPAFDGIKSAESLGSDLYFRRNPQVCAKVYLRSFLNEKNIRFDPHYVVAEDLLFNYTLLLYVKNLAFDQRTMYHYRMAAAGSVTSSVTVTSMQTFDALEDVYLKLERQNKHDVMAGFLSEAIDHFRWLLQVSASAEVYEARAWIVESIWQKRFNEYASDIRPEERYWYELFRDAKTPLDVMFWHSRDTLRHTENFQCDRQIWGGDLVRELEGAQAELNAEQGRLDELKGSTTYKVGRAVMALPCALKDRAQKRKEQA